MSETSEILRAYATQIDHNIALYNVTGTYPNDPVLPEVVTNMNAAADEIEHLKGMISDLAGIINRYNGVN